MTLTWNLQWLTSKLHLEMPFYCQMEPVGNWLGLLPFLRILILTRKKDKRGKKNHTTLISKNIIKFHLEYGSPVELLRLMLPAMVPCAVTAKPEVHSTFKWVRRTRQGSGKSQLLFNKPGLHSFISYLLHWSLHRQYQVTQLTCVMLKWMPLALSKPVQIVC